LKFKNPEMQVEVCKLVGKAAKFKGKKKKWWRHQVLWWKGEEIDRHSYQYQRLLDGAFNALSKNKKFRKALLATGNAKLKHSHGSKKKETHTVLTSREFCGRLERIRMKLKNG